MKSSPPNAPRFVCRLVRWRIALFGQEGQERSALAHSKHVVSCPECCAYFSATQQFESTLRRSAVRQPTAFPEGLEQRIVHAVRAAEPTSRPVRSRRKIMLAFGGLAAGAALALFVIQRAPESGQGNLAVNEHVTDSDARAIVAAAQALPQQLWSTLQPTAEKLTEQNPLQTELNSVYSNAQSAVSFLELNFLPSSYRSSQAAAPEQRG